MVDDTLIGALQTAVDWLEEHGYQYAVIGGIASQWWGIPRLTHDVDIKVQVPDLDYSTLRTGLRADFPERGRPHAPVNPLIVDVRIGPTTVDFLLAVPGYDEEIVARAVEVELEDLSLRLCTPEDLIIQKSIAGRAKDWQDIEGILIEQMDTLDLAYLENWLGQFAELLEQPGILSRLIAIRSRVSKVLSQLDGE